MTDRYSRLRIVLAGEPGPWTIRLAWVVLPFTAGPVLAAALDGRSDAVRAVASVGLWAGWTVALAASLIPRTATLTAIRLLMPAALAAALWATTWGAPADLGQGATAVALVSAMVVLGTVLSPLTGDAFVNGSSYGPERRFALRVPGALLLGPVVVAWAAVIALAVAGPLLLAAHQWIVGVLALALAVPVERVGLRALHGLSRRWVVFVPAGMVLHDPYTLTEPVLSPRRTVAALGPAPIDVGGLDATAGAPGLALCLELREPIEIGVKERGGRAAREVTTTRVLFTPTRPGALLQEAAGRRLPVG